MVDSSSVALLDEIKRKKDRILLWPFLAVFSVMVLVTSIVKSVPIWIVAPLATAFALATLFVAVRDQLRKCVVVLYDLEEDVELLFKRMHDSTLSLGSAGSIWNVIAQGRVHDPKYHAGAASLVRRNRISIVVGSPPFIRTNVSTICIKLSGTKLYLLPDRVLIYSNAGVGAIEYKSLILEIKATRFIESDAVPADANIVDHTWTYVNKDGGPDRRFSNNRQLPICQYEEIHFHSDSGLNELLQVSRCGLGEQLDLAIKDMGVVIQRLRSEAEKQTYKESYDKSVDDQPSVSSLEDVCEVLLNVLCCVMASDGRASTSERERIKQLMGKVQAPWSDEVIERRINEFIQRIRDVGSRVVFQDTLSSVEIFKRVGREKVLIRCIDEVADAAQGVGEQEQAMCRQIKQLLA
jgi:hypothetical protein